MIEQALQTFGNISLLEIAAFIIPFVAAIIIDLKSHKHGQAITMANAAIWSFIWFLCAVGFGAFIYFERGAEAAGFYSTGYLLEKALAIDNLFCFYLIFKSFGLTLDKNQHYQHKILYWGILGAIVFRVFFLGAGAFLVNLSPFVLLVFAAIILGTVWKMIKSKSDEGEVDYSNHWSVKGMKRFFKVNPSIDSGKFFSNGVTPLFLCLFCVEICDVIFAFDSMPVIVAVVQDPFLMITSSLWAAAGLRSLYFLLIAAQSKFWALDKAVMALLVFVAGKLALGAFHLHLPNVVSLSIITAILAIGILWSLIFKEKETAEEA